MKMEYETPIAEVVLSDADDVVLASPIQEGGGGWVNHETDPFMEP